MNAALALQPTPISHKPSDLRRFEGVRMSLVPKLISADPWASATAVQRMAAEARLGVLEPLIARIAEGASVSKVIELFMAQNAAGVLSANQAAAVRLLDKGLSAPNLRRWLADYRKGGKTALLPAHTGRVRQDYGWEQQAVDLFNLPSKPGYKGVAEHLKMQGFDTADESRVRRYLQSLPATQSKLSASRVGPHLHKLTRRTYQKRSMDELLVGEVYAGDGHTIDCYVANPNNGTPMRLELTAFIDIKSGFVAGWWFSESESGESTLYALSHAMATHNHVPAWLYIDRGAGYRSKMLIDENTGFYAKYDIGTIAALPGNPHGKGWIERFFRTLRDRHDKFFDNGMAYCGDDAADETNRRMSVEVRAGRRQLRSVDEYVASFKQWLDHYHNTLLEERGQTPAAAWAQLTRVAVDLDVLAIARPAKACAVSRQQVRLHNRHYYHPALALFDGVILKVEFSLHDDSNVWIYNGQGAFVCKADLAKTIGVLPTSLIEEGRDRRLKGQVKRLERKLGEAKSAREDAITVEARMSAIDALTAAPPNKLIAPRAKAGMSPFKPKDDVQDVPYVHPADEDDFDIDITDYQS
jgi:putative transposase